MILLLCGRFTGGGGGGGGGGVFTVSSSAFIIVFECYCAIVIDEIDGER